MLSNQTTNLQQRQRQHRRQISTPNAFDAPKVPLLPATAIQRQASHRRGLSLDQRIQQQQLRQQKSQQDDRTVSTNSGLQQQQQHILREAQQQRLARPGQQHNTHNAHPHGQQCVIKPQIQLIEPSSGTGLPNDTLFEEQDLFDPTNSDSGNRLGSIDVTTSFSAFDTTTSAEYFDGFGLEQEAKVGPKAIGGERMTPCRSTGAIDTRERWSLYPDWDVQQRRPRTPPDQSSSSRH